METIAVRNVSDIGADEKRSLEDLIGARLQENQQVFIMVFTPGLEPDSVSREAAMNNVETILEEAHRNATAQGITSEEADAAVEEAMNHVRRRRP